MHTLFSDSRFGVQRTAATFNCFLAMLCGTIVAGAEPSAEAFRLAQTVAAVQSNLPLARIESTGLQRADYLETIGGIVHYFRNFQTQDGRIIDPFRHKEIQYSTPCYAWAATALIVSGRDSNLLDSAARALDSSLRQLASGNAADGHGDFFTFPAMLAYENLRDRVPSEQRQKWATLLREIVPEKAYRDVLTEKHKVVHNWNVVALSGEFLRAQNDFTDLAFVERHLNGQWQYFTPDGLYRDPNVPLAYDHFPRHFLAVLSQRGYSGSHRVRLEETLERAAWTSLLMQSPLGELPTGGRSAQHQWNEAEQCVTYEIWCERKKLAGDAVAAGAFKRAAHLSLQSVQRWVRPSGELWIVKNRFDPALRHGFEGYSSHSQYNLLAASMLATAWQFAKDDVTEAPCPADVGGFAFELPEFHKVIANAGGLYLEIDTAADPHYNSTGLLRVHKRGVNGLLGPSDSAPADQLPLATGIAWLEGKEWKRLASLKPRGAPRSTLSVDKATPSDVQFSVHYDVDQPTVRGVVETYQITTNEIRVTAEVDGEAPVLRVAFPALVFDGANAPRVMITNGTATVSLANDQQRFTIEDPRGAKLALAGQPVRCRNGFLQAVEAEVPGKRVTYSLRPQHVGATK